MAQTIQIYRTNSNTPPTTLLSGVLSAELGAQTKLWIGSGSGNRLLLSSDPADSGAASSAYLKLAGGTLTGPLVLAADPLVALGAATKQYADTKDALRLALAGGTLTGPLVLAGNAAAPLNPVSLQQLNAAVAPLALTSSLAAYAPLVSPVLTGDPQAPTPATTDNDTSIATTAFVQAAAAAAAAAVTGNASNITSGVLSAQRLDLGTRLAAAGTKLNALGPTTLNNSPSGASPVTAMDAALNYYAGASTTPVWNLPPVVPGACLSILCASSSISTTIKPASGDSILAPGGVTYANATPLVFPKTPFSNFSLIYLASASAAQWTILSASSEIEAAMGWVTRPYFQGVYAAAGNLAITSGAWTHCPMDSVQQDNFGWWDAGNQWYLPKRSGIYRAIFEASLTAPAGVSGYAGIYFNGAGVAVRQVLGFTGTCVQVCATSLLRCNGTTDNIMPYIYAAATSPSITGSATNQFMIEYVGP